MVEICRWLKASFSVSLTACSETPSWPARWRSTFSAARKPPSCASEDTSRKIGLRRSSFTSALDHFTTSSRSVPGISVYFQPVQDIQISTKASRSQYQYTLTGTDRNEVVKWSNALVHEM